MAALPPGVTVQAPPAPRPTGHRTARRTPAGVAGGARRPLLADPVVLTLGHLDAEPDDEQRALSAFAAEHELVHLPPDFTADSDLSALRPGEPVLVRGFGLAFVDLMVLLTEGRGGRYERARRGAGLPALRARTRAVRRLAARRPVPLQDRLRAVRRTAAAAPLLRPRPGRGAAAAPRTARLPARRVAAGRQGARIRPLPPAVHRPPRAYGRRLVRLRGEVRGRPPGSAELHALVAAAVPDPADRLDLDALDHPLDGLRSPARRTPGGAARLHRGRSRPPPRPRAQHRTWPSSSACSPSTASSSGSATSATAWWHGFFSYLASGPPGPRLDSCSRSPAPGSSGSSAPR